MEFANLEDVYRFYLTEYKLITNKTHNIFI